MSDLDHRPGVKEVNLVVRHLKLDKPEASQLQAALDEIDQIVGLDSIHYDEPSQTLNLAYDASQTNLDNIETLLKGHGIEVAHDWWTRFKEGYYRFIDQNVKDNAEHTPWCCHQSPKVPPKR